MNSLEEVVLGIDFGSSNCSVSYYHLGEIKSLFLDSDSTIKTCPTCIYIDKKTDILKVSKKPSYQDLDEDYFFIDKIKERLVTKEPIIYKEKELSLVHLIGEIYLNLKRELELKLGLSVKKAVITVPAYFGEEPRHILKNAAKMADLEVLRIINEPTAAALWYSSEYKSIESTYLFVDIGGLTIDMSICNLMNGVLDVVSTYGNTSAGHGVIDKKIYDKLLDQIKQNYPELYLLIENEKNNGLLKNQLLALSEELKRNFSDTPSPEIFFHKDLYFNKKLYTCYFKFTKKELYAIYYQFLTLVEEIYLETLRRSGLKADKISTLILIGGPASSALLRKLLQEKIPIVQAEYFDNISSVSKGAALYGAELLGQSFNIVLSDVVPISIGVQVENGIIEKLIPANTKLPNYVLKEFTTTEDYQTKVRVSIYEGERLLAKDCAKLGEINLEGIELGLRGQPIIKVILEITQEGVINGYVLDQKTKKEAQIKISSKHRYTESQILFLKEQAIRYREIDLEHIQLLNLNAEIRNLQKKLILLKNTIKENFLKEKIYFLELKIKNTIEFNYKKKEILLNLKEQLVSFLKTTPQYGLETTTIKNPTL